MDCIMDIIKLCKTAWILTHVAVASFCLPMMQQHTLLLTRLAPNSYVPIGIFKGWLFCVGTSMLPINMLKHRNDGQGL